MHPKFLGAGCLVRTENFRLSINNCMSTYKSPPVSCLDCRKTLSAKGIFSHFILAHTPAGQQAAINRGKLSQPFTQNTTANRIECEINNYLKSPKLCTECRSALSYNKKNNKFCSQTCSAVYNNRNRIQSGYSASERQRASARKQAEKKRTERLANELTKPKFTKVLPCKVCKSFFPVIREETTCSVECRTSIWSNTAKNNSCMGGNKNTRAYGWYTSPYAGKVWLESSYELKVARELDSNHIDWSRPSYLPYGDGKKYYADFLLTEQKIYLDPKNDYLITQDSQKINQVMLENHVVIIILDKDNLTWVKIRNMLDTGFEPAMDN